MSTKYRVLFVVNPISGGIDKSEIIDHIKDKLKQAGSELYIFYTTGKNDKEEAAQVFQDFQPHRILVAGGDGTLKLLAEIIKDRSVPIGLFPAGSANGLAENLQLSTSMKENAKIALGDNFVNVDCIDVNGELCLHISDIGLNAALIKNYEEGNIRGKLGYIIQSLPTLLKTDYPFDFVIKAEGETIKRKAVLLAIANAKKYGTGSKINPKGNFLDGKFEILIFKKLDLPQILKTFKEHVELDKDFLEIISVKEAIIKCAKDVPFQIDGEYRGSVREVVAKISHYKIKLAVPEGWQEKT